MTARAGAEVAILGDDGVVVTGAMLDRVAAYVGGHAAAWFPGMPSAPGAGVVLRRLGEASSYPLFAADLPGGAGVIVKFAPVFPGNNEGMTEYRHLCAMHERLGAGGPLRVARPLAFLDDVNALVMERVGGERFSRVLLRAGGRLAGADDARRIQHWARQCGEWLACYHAVNRRGEEAAFGGDFAARVEEKLDLLARHGFTDAVARAARDTVERLADFGRGCAVTVADQHGDYGPQNVHVGDGYIYVFDLNYHAAAPVYEDIGYFLVTLETMNPYPKQWLFDRRRVAALRDPFLRGYFGDDGDAAARRVLIEGYYIKSLLFRCAKQRRNTSKRGRAALAAFDALRLRGYYPRRVARQCEVAGAALAAARRRGL